MRHDRVNGRLPRDGAEEHGDGVGGGELEVVVPEVSCFEFRMEGDNQTIVGK